MVSCRTIRPISTTFTGLTVLYTCDFADYFDRRLGVLFGGLHFDSVKDVSYAVLASCCSVSRSAKWTTFAVWMPKKMYRISVFFFLALIRRMS